MAQADDDRPRTRWQGPPVHVGSGRFDEKASCAARRVAPPRPEREAARNELEHLMRASLAQGHWRVALRRCRMLTAMGIDAPPDLRDECARLASRMTQRELEKIEHDAASWALLAREAALFQDAQLFRD